jgi:hypothetical protein
VAEYFGTKLDKQGLRAVGVTLFHADFGACSESREELQAIAISYLKDSLSLTDDDCLESGGTLLNLSSMNAAIKNHKQAFEDIEKAIRMYETYNLSLNTDPPPPFREVYLWNDRPDVMLWSVSTTSTQE